MFQNLQAKSRMIKYYAVENIHYQSGEEKVVTVIFTHVNCATIGSEALYYLHITYVIQILQRRIILSILLTLNILIRKY